MPILKKALIRCPENCCPVGTQGHMRIDCLCGRSIHLEKNHTGDITCRRCKARFDERGWILYRGRPVLVDEGNGLWGVEKEGRRVVTGESYQVASNICEHGNSHSETDEVRESLA